MLEAVTRAASPLPWIAIMVVAVAVVVGIAVTWNLEPWFRKYVKASKLNKLCKDMIRAYNTRKKCPQAFDPSDPLYMAPPTQHLLPADVERIGELFGKILDEREAATNGK